MTAAHTLTPAHTRNVGVHPVLVAPGAHTLPEAPTAHAAPEMLQRRIDRLEDKLASLRAFVTLMVVVLTLSNGLLFAILNQRTAPAPTDPAPTSEVVEGPYTEVWHLVPATELPANGADLLGDASGPRP